MRVGSDVYETCSHCLQTRAKFGAVTAAAWPERSFASAQSGPAASELGHHRLSASPEPTSESARGDKNFSIYLRSAALVPVSTRPTMGPN